MALQKQNIVLPIDKGLDTKLDPKQEEIGFLRKAQNVVYETVRMLRKRNGYVLLDAVTSTNAEISNPIKLAKLKSELLLFTDTNLYAYSETRAQFVDRGHISSVSSKEISIIKNANSQSQVDGMTLEGFTIFAWTDSSGGVKYSVQDIVNGSFIVSNVSVSATGERPVLASAEGTVFIVYGEGANLRFKTFSILAPETLSAATLIASDLSTTNGLIDAESASDRIIVAYNADNSGDNVSLLTLLPDGSASSIVQITGESATHALDVSIDSNSRVVVAYSDNTAVKYTIFPLTLAAALLTETVVETIAGVTSLCITNPSSGNYEIYFEVSAPGVGTNYIKRADLDTSGTVTNLEVFKRSVGLGARAFRRDGVTYVVAVLDSEVQSSYFIFNENGKITTKLANQTAAGPIDYGVLQPVIESSTDDTFLVPLIVHSRVQSDNGTFFSTDGVAAVLLNFSPATVYSNAQMAETLHICAGILKGYDGATVTEHGILVFPEVLTKKTPLDITIATTTQGVVPVSEVQKLSYSATPASGTFKITIGAETTGALNWNDSNATIETAIEAFTAITAVTITGSFAAGHTITFDDPVAPITQITITDNLLLDGGAAAITVTPTTLTEGVTGVPEVQTISFSAVPTVGEFTLNIDTEITAAVNYTQGAPELKAAIEALPSITTVTVTGNFTTGFTVTFDAPVAPIEQAIVNSTSLNTISTPGELTNGTRSYVAVYRWTDNNGRDHRSTPTLTPLQVVLSGGSDTQAVTVRVPTLRVTEKEDVVLELYRTEDAGVTYYKVTDDLNPIISDPTVDYIDILDTVSDADLISNQILYTTGGVLENIAAPAAFQVTAYNGNRLAVVDEASTRVFFSKQLTEGGPVEFTDAIYRDIDPVGGTVNAIASMNEKLLIFTKDACFYVSGDGPTNVGLQDTMNTPEVIALDIGCIDPDSTVLTPGGTVFKSRKGIWRVGPGLGLEYVGARAEEFNSTVITSAQIVGELNQLRFTLSRDRALVYNYHLDKWATFENHGARSAIVIGNDYYYLREDGSLYKEDRETFSDAGSTIKMRIETGWMSFADLQGFQRAYHLLLLGSFKSPHKIRVKISYDFIESYVQEVLIDTANFVSAPLYGSDPTYGDSPVYGGYGALEQMRVNLKQQKCQAIKLTIEDAQSTPGEGLSLSGITIRAGAKDGTNKMAAIRKFGAS